MTEMINELNRKYNCTIDIRDLSVKYLKVNTGREKHEEKRNNIITPDRDYVNRLIKELDSIRGKLGVVEYNRCRNELRNILITGDFDDNEDIMQSVHETLENRIYKSDTKVKNADWKFLENYLMKAGYKPVAVKVGDNIKDYAVYFENQIPSSDNGKKGTIKLISQRPYILKYDDGGFVEKLKLCGKCIYYK
ncbi:MAG: hypothetical protein K2I06_08535 [Ruminococcus sp.]|nr:hypothetical protein [Ruminococcus sp.]